MPSFNATSEIALSRKKNSASKVANWIIVDILEYLYINLMLSLVNS